MEAPAEKPLAPISELKRVLGALFAVPKAANDEAEATRIKRAHAKAGQRDD